MNSLARRLILLLIALLGVLSSVIAASPLSAAGETFTWKDFRTITVTGPDLKGPSDVTLTNQEVTGDTLAILGGNVVFNKGPDSRGCTVFLRIFLFKSSGTGAGRLWAPPPTGPGINDPNVPPKCSDVNQDGVRAALHDQWVTIGGTRPADPNAPERPEEKRFDVFVFAPDPLSRVPPSDTVFIYRSDGTKVGEQSAPFEDDSGAADWPPDQTPASMRVTFTLEPGDYVACDTYVAKECDYAKAPANQKFKKEKYKTGTLSLGTLFQTPDKKRITGTVQYHAKRACGATLNVSPINVELTGPDGKVYNQLTEAGVSRPQPSENDALCTVEVMLGLTATFENMPPGDYKACATGAPCVTVTKKDGEAASFTLVIKTEQTAPPNDQVCTSGDGVAGGLAWVICPATQLIAGATDFFEKNIIVPFMTVSPLTTNAANPIYILWQNFRDVANVSFVVLLFISIFSIALSKYGLKRIMPRLLLVAIGINLSYFIIALVIDAFNILGGGISQLITSALQQAGTTQLNTGTSAGPVRSIFTLGGAALLAILLTGGAALGWLFSFVGIAALIVVVVVIVLIIRQLAIITLVVLSPLAILLYLLPNTESYFRKWRELLIQLLLMYPMIVLLFAAGKIFGVILQQPDFQLAGDGVSEDVAQGVRVILQFLVYVLPLVLLPATFAASGALMGKAYALMANNKRVRQLASRPGKAFEENVAKPMRQEMQMRAARRGGRIGQLAGYNMRQQFKREQREKELSRAQQEYIARQASNERFAASAAGIGGQAAATRVQGTAVTQLEKTRKEEIANEKAIFLHELRQLGLSTKEFNTQFSDFLRNPSRSTVTGTLRDASGALRTIDLSQRQDIARSALNEAAAAGEITTLEQARLSSGIDQNMLDEVIRDHDGAIKGKGGYHLATNFNLAHGRSEGTQRDIHLARLRETFAGSAGTDIADMKASFVADVARTLRDPATRATLFSGPGALTADERNTIRENIARVTGNDDVKASAKNIRALEEIERLI